ncbi:MAG: ABC-F family ATP-binding cassette domain-containing protein, partial [Clostridiales bacterium]|nr:ABC-F family ATP-binding cassette domain-containing protein [Clostridiales bacterium]
RKISEGKSRITIPRDSVIGYLEQSPDYPGKMKVGEILALAFKELEAMEEQLGILENKMGMLEGEELDKALKNYGKLQQEYEVKGGHERIEKLGKVCAGLGFSAEFLEKDFDVLSGGEKTIVSLGRILLEAPDILLLDEPTNHLDVKAIEWLENYLEKYRGIVILVSHDRYFLDKVANKIIELENGCCEVYKGNYSEYVRQRDEKLLLQLQSYREQKKEVGSIEKTIKELRDWAQRSDNNKFFRRAASLQKKLEKMEMIERPVLEKQKMKLDFKDTDRSGYRIIEATGLKKSFGGRLLFRDANLQVIKGERVALVGPNGSGKTTLIRILLGEAVADEGEVKLGAGLKQAFLPQIIEFENEDASILECFRESRYILEGKAREYLSRFMFFGKSVYNKVGQLSGGERVRLKLAMLMYDGINLLVLDEPTNHLDIDSMEVFEEALEDFEGTILFVSHDRYFTNKICTKVLALEEGSLVSCQGDYENYRRIREETAKNGQVTDKGAGRKRFKEPEKLSIEEENEKRLKYSSKLEAAIREKEDEVKVLSARMTAPGIGYEELNELYQQKEALEGEIDSLIGMYYLQ